MFHVYECSFTIPNPLPIQDTKTTQRVLPVFPQRTVMYPTQCDMRLSSVMCHSSARGFCSSNLLNTMLFVDTFVLPFTGRAPCGFFPSSCGSRVFSVVPLVLHRFSRVGHSSKTGSRRSLRVHKSGNPCPQSDTKPPGVRMWAWEA